MLPKEECYLIILEPPQGIISDVIRFNENNTLVFYSDNTDGAEDLADTGFPSALYTNQVIVTEMGTEGNNGFTYTPLPGQPGFQPNAGGPVSYVIISGAPESGSGSLALLCLTGLPLAVRVAIRKRCIS